MPQLPKLATWTRRSHGLSNAGPGKENWTSAEASGASEAAPELKGGTDRLTLVAWVRSGVALAKDRLTAPAARAMPGSPGRLCANAA